MAEYHFDNQVISDTGRNRIIYLDNAATTPLCAAAREAIGRLLRESFANPSSQHREGREARSRIDAARDAVAEVFGGDYSEIYFTSGGTEADNLALFGAMMAAPSDRNHLIVSAIEHHAVLDAARKLEKWGRKVSYLPVNRQGVVEIESLNSAITDRTALVSVMHANNEIGTIQAIEELAAVAHQYGALFHTDAVQSVSSMPIDVNRLGVDLLSFSAHKFYGPKGVGGLYVRKGIAISPLMHGGSQERELRPGTENIIGIVALAAALKWTSAHRERDIKRIARFRRRLEDRLEAISGVSVNAKAAGRLPGIVNISVDGVEAQSLLLRLDRMGVAASAGSACSSGALEPSHVLLALGYNREEASQCIRLSLGRYTTISDIELASDRIAEAITAIRKTGSKI